MSLQFSDAKFSRDSVHHKLLKSVHFSSSYLKYKKRDVFETQCIFKTSNDTFEYVNGVVYDVHGVEVAAESRQGAVTWRRGRSRGTNARRSCRKRSHCRRSSSRSAM